MNTSYMQALMAHLKETLEKRLIGAELERKVSDGTSSAGTDRENIFTRDYLCPAIADFCNNLAAPLKLSDEDVCKGLGTEGWKKCKGFGFTPARDSPHLFTKSDVIKSNPPTYWFNSNTKSLRNSQACPDFAIRHPLPFSVVGETKVIKRRVSPEAALKELYNTARQAIFYLGAFSGAYESALLVMADASPGHSFVNGVEQSAHPQLLTRFGSDSGIYLSIIRIN